MTHFIISQNPLITWKSLQIVGLNVSRKRNSEITLNYFLLCVILWCHIPCELWNAILKRRDFLEIIALNGRIILKHILKK